MMGKKDTVEQYQVVYRGGLAAIPKGKAAAIKLKLGADAFSLEPTPAAAKFWQPLTIPYASISAVRIVARQVSTVEGLLGGLNSRQLNQDNNIHIEYTDAAGTAVLLRLEMLTGITVMGQAKRCREFEDRLRTGGISARFASSSSGPTAAVANDIPEQISKLAVLRDQGILTEEEFSTKKAELLAKI